ncbi:PREDICTED: translation initiation factor eIF-2B subunit delta isoform X2 [Rhagoletis zephyria]|uniref:translation initiation factor eIF-2B subunit delta isoform X2 n=1 Tax=Rhagoletis zephyria TaxID=28612 RepID=UPI0008112B97|nr:PREDICTED: translation initiation factor eIF-2B subunit delta isoform X2 [Rhagoletis zephyria]
MSGIQENKEQLSKTKSKSEGSIAGQKKKRAGPRQRKRNKINKSLALGSEATFELPQSDGIEAVEPDVIGPSNFSTNNTKVAVEQSSSDCILKEKSETKHTQVNITGFKKQLVEETTMSSNPTSVNSAPGKTREEIIAEREAKKLAKQTKKAKPLSTGPQATTLIAPVASKSIALAVGGQKTPPDNSLSNIAVTNTPAAGIDKTREQIKAEREAKKKAKQVLKEAKATGVPEITAQLEATKITTKLDSTTAQEDKKKPTLSKAERRALQEAQRAAKAQKNVTAQKKPGTSNNAKDIPKASPSNTPVKAASTIPASTSPTKNSSPLTKSLRLNDCKVRLFNHLEKARQDVSLFLNNPHIHPSIARLGEQYAKRTIVGSNARCIAFLNALKMVIRDFETPPKKEFTRGLETTITNSVEHLQKCRPLAVSVSNAYKHIKHVLTQLPTDQPETDLKENLCRFIDTYIENQIGKAAEAISYSVQEKISNGDVILTFGCSSLITYIFEEAQRRRVDFRVIVVDSRPFCEGQELLRRLTVKEIPCTYVLINAISFVMPEATKVLLGAHALLANGYVMARTGTAQVALVAHSFNVPVLVCCETHKFSERSQTDAIVYNELGNPDDLIRSEKCSLANWQSKGKMSPLNLMYDITPSELVTAVVTEVSILPCTSVPVILRIKPTEIGY